MGIAIPQVITSDRASGAQVIGGSLKFDSVLKIVLIELPLAVQELLGHLPYGLKNKIMIVMFLVQVM